MIEKNWKELIASQTFIKLNMTMMKSQKQLLLQNQLKEDL